MESHVFPGEVELHHLGLADRQLAELEGERLADLAGRVEADHVVGGLFQTMPVWFTATKARRQAPPLSAASLSSMEIPLS